jgi:PEP-CTERM motif
MKVTGLLFALVMAQLSYGTMVSIGPVPSTGTGLGAVNTVLTFTSPGSSTNESGCVGAGPGGTVITGPSVCPGNGPSGLAPFTGGNEQAQNHVYTAAMLGLTNFANLQVIFNGSEPQSPGGSAITLENLALTLYSPAGGLLGAFYIETPLVLTDIFPGTGNSGFGFQFDAPQATAANLLLAAFPGLYIGASAVASGASGGMETISIRNTNVSGDIVVPEPATLGLIGLAALALGGFRRRLS